jgi:hypothetical protein
MPAGEAQFIVHGPGTVRIRGVDHHRTGRPQLSEELRHLETITWIAGSARHRIEIVIERDHCRARQP